MSRPLRPSPTWRTFLDTHFRELVAVDFFVVPTLTFRLLFAFIVLRHNRRELLHINVTDHPTAAWVAQQIVETFPDDTAPKYLLRDRDTIYGEVFQRRLTHMGIRQVLIAPHAPWQRARRRIAAGSSGRQRYVDRLNDDGRRLLPPWRRSFLPLAILIRPADTRLGLALAARVT